MADRTRRSGGAFGSARHVADHVSDPDVRKVPGAGHMGAWVKPQAYADELVRFFEKRLTPA